jgi:glycosyltransferase involved in cell wall biosynthesis
VELRYAAAATCCDWIVGICDATANNLKSAHMIPLGKIVRVYNGTAPLQRVAKKECPSKGGFTLVYVGRLAPVKNHALLLNAFRSACSAVPGLTLWMVGDGIERPRLEALANELGIAKSVTFWGEQLDVAPFFSGADAFIMSSKSEGLPISLLQGFSLGLPAIVTDVGGMAEVVCQAKAGITVSATDASEMAAAILRLAGSEKEREQFSMNAKASFFARFTLETMLVSYTNLYRNSSRGQRDRRTRAES